jgi:predicted DNA-binding protein
MSNVSIRIPDKLNTVLMNMCQEEERSKSWIIKKALEHYLEDRQDYKDATLALKNHDSKNNYTLDEVIKLAGLEQ